MSILNKFFKRIVAADYFINRHTAIKRDGLSVMKVAVATFDTAQNDSSGVSNKTQAAHGLGVYLPDNALVLRSWYEVIAIFTSSGDTATIALKVEGANDLVNAIAINGSGDPWDAGQFGCLPLAPDLGADAAHDSQIEVVKLFADLQIKLTAERELTATVATQDLTAGKLVLYVEYVLSD